MSRTTVPFLNFADVQSETKTTTRNVPDPISVLYLFHYFLEREREREKYARKISARKKRLSA